MSLKWKSLIASLISLWIVLIHQYVTTFVRNPNLFLPAEAVLHSYKVCYFEFEYLLRGQQTLGRWYTSLAARHSVKWKGADKTEEDLETSN